MTSIKVKLRISKVSGKEGTIYYQLIHNRTVRQITTPYRLSKSNWDKTKSRVIVSDKILNNKEATLAESIRLDICRLARIVSKYDNRGLEYTTDDVIEAYHEYMRQYSVFSYMSDNIQKLKEMGKVRTAETYTSALNSFKKYRDGIDMMLDAITSDTIEEYEAYLYGNGVVRNTISFYMRILRSVYNKAVEKSIIEGCKPFLHVYTGTDKTIKRALPITSIRKIKKLNLSRQPKLRYARDMFLLSFYLRGMSFIDMAFLRKSDLRDGYVTYRRRKTSQTLTIKWTAEMQTIIDRYPDNTTPYLLPIIKKCSTSERNIYRNASYAINRNLKTIATLAGIDTRLTMYCARHSWATVAQTSGVPITVIRDGMGHNSETTTQIYLASLDTSAVDKANAKIIRRI